MVRTASQELKQDICQRYGWSYEIVSQKQHRDTSTVSGMHNVHAVSSVSYDDNNSPLHTVWTCTMIVGFQDRRVFVSTVSELDVCQMALDGLRHEIEHNEAKRMVTDLVHVFPHPIPIYDSQQVDHWDYFWKHPPTVVGIDTEGNGRSPPVLVQIATPTYCILEAPVYPMGISDNLTRLLNDTTIVKVFCDNYSHRDKKSLGIPNSSALDLTRGHIVDLENMMSQYFGPVSVPRGLSRIVTLCMPELNVTIRKPKQRFQSIGRFALIEHGKVPPLTSIYDLSLQELQYAALDAWCTLKAYERIGELLLVATGP
jgi:hypothetical protein